MKRGVRQASVEPTVATKKRRLSAPRARIEKAKPVVDASFWNEFPRTEAEYDRNLPPKMDGFPRKRFNNRIWPAAKYFTDAAIEGKRRSYV